MLSCETHSAQIFDRGGKTLITPLEGVISVQWERLRDDTSVAKVTVSQRASNDCHRAVGLIGTGRHELAIYRGQVLVWVGPITHLEYRKSEATITARDVTHYLNRMIMKGEYNNAHPNTTTVVRRAARIIRAEAARFEAQNPPINIVPFLEPHDRPDYFVDGERRRRDAGTSTHTLRYHSNVYEHIDQLAARAGLDYTAIGRAIHLWDVRNPAMGQTGTISQKDFIGETIITEYGMDLCTVAAMTDGKGRYGQYGSAHPYYGLVEMVETAYDEDTGEDWNQIDPTPPTVAEMRSQAQRMIKVPPPLVVRVPDNSTLNPNGTLSINELVPGVFIPLEAELPGRQLSQMQKLDSVKVSETAEEGEQVQVILSPAPDPKDDVPIEG